MAEAADIDGLSELVLLPSGEAFGSYVVHECIGQGAMGNVYRAEHTLLEKPVALKVMDASLLASADARQRFLREGQAAAAIKHPNVVDITDVGVFEGTPYLVMELLEGEDLQIYLERRQHLSETEIASLLLPITAALGAAHDRGVVHRDLKPSNIFLSRGPDGEIIPKILDFGISKIGQAVTSTDFESTPFNQLMGSPLYLPPEAVRGSRDLTAKSDQYSLGVVLYECVTGHPPFGGDTLMSLLNSISSGDFLRPSHFRPDVSMAMEHAVLRAMNPDPALRFDHVRDLGRELLMVAGMRTQMLWGRTFGRLDLSEPPPPGPRTTSPVALLRIPTDPPREAPAAPAEKPRSNRHVMLGVATLLAILIPNLWAMRAPQDRSVTASALAPLEHLPEPALSPPLPAEAVAWPQPRTLPAPAALPAPASDVVLGDTPSADGSALDRRRTEGGKTAERSRSGKRARAAAAGLTDSQRLPRASIVPERPRPGILLDRLSDPYSDDVRELFPGPASAREGASRAPALGANESPILD